MEKATRNELYGLISAAVAENPRLQSGLLEAAAAARRAAESIDRGMWAEALVDLDKASIICKSRQEWQKHGKQN